MRSVSRKLEGKKEDGWRVESEEDGMKRRGRGEGKGKGKLDGEK